MGEPQPAFNKEKEERPKKRSQPPPRPPLPQPPRPSRACAHGRPPPASWGGGDAGARTGGTAGGKPKAASPWGPQAKQRVENASVTSRAHSPRAGDGLPRHHTSPPKMRIVNTGTDNPPAHAEPTASHRRPIRLPRANNGAGLGTRGSAKAETHR